MKKQNKIVYKGLSRQAKRTRKKLRYGGGSTTTKSKCTKHKMPDGTIMDGPVHGPNQTCVEWSDDTTMYSRGGIISDCKDIEGQTLCITSGCSWDFNDSVCLQ